MITDMVGGAAARWKSMLAGFTTGQKAMTILGALALILGVVWFAQWASKPSYAPLYSNLSGADASAITDVLTSKGTEYQLADGGTTVLVPQSALYQARLDVSAQGLPSDTGSTSGMLDAQGVTASEKMQEEGIRRALEAELAKTIESIDGVDTAAVKLAIPKKDIFSDNTTDKPTASVLVSMQNGKQLGSNQVQAITTLVAHSVPEMSSEDVSVTDSAGNVLSAGGGESSLGLTSDRLAQTRAIETAKAASAQAMLDKLLGPGNAIVKVAAELDWDKTTTKSTTYTPNNRLLPIAETASNETYQGTGTGAGGQLGVDSSAAPLLANGTTNKYDKKSSTLNRVVDTTVEERTQTPGQIKRLSVSVLVNNQAAGGAVPSQLDIENAVANAVGLDRTRGDVIVATPQAFASESASPEAAPAAIGGMSYMQIAKVAGLVLVVILTLLIAFLNGRRNAKIAAAERQALEDAEAQWIEALRQDSVDRAAGAGAIEGGDPMAIEAGQVDMEAERRKIIRQEITDLVQRQPDEVAQLLRGWLADRRR